MRPNLKKDKQTFPKEQTHPLPVLLRSWWGRGGVVVVVTAENH